MARGCAEASAQRSPHPATQNAQSGAGDHPLYNPPERFCCAPLSLYGSGRRPGGLAHGLSDPDGLGNVVGYFANPVVLRAHLAGNPTFEAVLRRMHQTVLDGFAHQHYPFPVLVEQLHTARDPSRSPLFQVMFVFQQTR